MIRKAKRGPVAKVEVPVGSLAAKAFSHADYADAYRIEVAQGQDVLTVARAIFSTMPGWVLALMNVRDRVVGLFGLKTTRPGAKPDPQKLTFEPGTRLGIFQVYQRTAQEVLLGEDDRHLDFRVSVMLESNLDTSWAFLSTVVHFNSWLGKLYFIPVRPFHRLIVVALLRQTSEYLAVAPPSIK